MEFLRQRLKRIYKNNKGFWGVGKMKRFRKWLEKFEEVEKIREKDVIDGINELYLEYQEMCPIRDNVILLESQNGKGISESIIALMNVLQKEAAYQSYEVYFSSVEESKAQRIKYLKVVGFTKIKVLTYDTPEYYQILATAKYLINDACFRSTFIKRKEQIYVKFWAHTQLNVVGRSQSTNYAQNGIVQKNLFDADYIICPNEFTKNVLLKDYMIENFAKGKFLMSDGFQAEMIQDEVRRKEIREKFGIQEKKVFVYIPQGRPKEQDKLLYIESLWKDFAKLDTLLDDSCLLYVSLNASVLQGRNFDGFRHIQKIPTSYGQYRILSAVDGLITDASNLIFEYAGCGRKIILLQLESQQYIEKKEMYAELLQMPFPKATSVEMLAKEVKKEKNYDDKQFLEAYCKYNKKGMASLVCAKVILGEENDALEVKEMNDNGKRNIVIYPGGLEKNGITSSIINMLSNVDTKKYNYMIVYRMEFLRENPYVLRDLPEDVVWYGYSYVRGVSRKDTMLYEYWLYHPLVDYTIAKNMLYRRAEHEKDRLFSHCRIDHVVQYNGYGTDMIVTMQRMSCGRTVYVHNNMIKELEEKSGMNKNLLSKAYQDYDTVALVSEDHRKITKKLARTYFFGTANIKLAKNIINYKRIETLAQKEFSLDESTLLNVEEATLKQILDSSAKKFITIGRFSKEKGHSRLIDAFVEIHKDNPDTYLIILGGYGELYEETVQKAKQAECREHIVIIQYLSNPYALLKLCDYFVLSSFHEGLPVVLAEADIVGKPSISTNIEGPRRFMEEYGGNLVPNSTKGIQDGMQMCLDGTVKQRLQIDYEQYNKEAMEQFESLLK